MPPTKAEITYFTAPEQAWLQKEWEPAVGDVFLKHAMGHTEVLLDQDARQTGWWTIQLGIGAGSTKHFWPSPQLSSPSAIWLPTLSDLLGMIQRLGYKVKIGQDLYTYVADAYAHKTKPAEQAKDERGWEIAAAKLLKRLNDGPT